LKVPGRTNSDIIIELEKAVAVVKERVNTIDSMLAEFKDQRDRLIKLEVKLEQLDKQRSEEHGKSWAIKLAIVSALIGSGVTILTQLLSRYLLVK
jgi:hypothetical protein